MSKEITLEDLMNKIDNLEKKIDNLSIAKPVATASGSGNYVETIKNELKELSAKRDSDAKNQCIKACINNISYPNDVNEYASILSFVYGYFLSCILTDYGTKKPFLNGGHCEIREGRIWRAKLCEGVLFGENLYKDNKDLMNIIKTIRAKYDELHEKNPETFLTLM